MKAYAKHNAAITLNNNFIFDDSLDVEIKPNNKPRPIPKKVPTTFF